MRLHCRFLTDVRPARHFGERHMFPVAATESACELYLPRKYYKQFFERLKTIRGFTHALTLQVIAHIPILLCLF